MKKFLFIATFCLLVMSTNAQTKNPDVTKTYIEIVSQHKSSTPTIDNGDGKGSNIYVTESGDRIEFFSSIGAVNWFVSNGWKLESEHISACNDRTIKMYVVSKEIPSEKAKSAQSKYFKK